MTFEFCISATPDECPIAFADDLGILTPCGPEAIRGLMKFIETKMSDGTVVKFPDPSSTPRDRTRVKILNESSRKMVKGFRAAVNEASRKKVPLQEILTVN